MADENIEKLAGVIMMRLKRSKEPIVANVSNRHLHLSRKDLETLFGPGYQLSNIKNLVQPGQYACKETVQIVGPKGKLETVRVIGPVRKQTQVEISKTDSFVLGLNPPVRDSGDLAGSSPIKIIGPKGTVELKEGCIIAKRHIHFTPKDAERFGVKDKEMLRVRVEGERGLIFENVLCRVREDMALECHIDTDEANAAGLKNGDLVRIV